MCDWSFFLHSGLDSWDVEGVTGNESMNSAFWVQHSKENIRNNTTDLLLAQAWYTPNSVVYFKHLYSLVWKVGRFSEIQLK